MRVFMLGWEFPPFISGGLGTACYGLTKALDQLGVEVIFCLPKMVESRYVTHVKLLTPDSQMSAGSFKFGEFKKVKFHAIDSPLLPYSTPDIYQRRIEESLRRKQQMYGGNISSASQLMGGMDYCGDMYAEVYRYAAIAAQLAKQEQFDIVHAHDWMTYPAGIAVARMSG